MKLDARCEPIEMIVSDVDGVLTSGGLIFDNQGIELKQFYVRDGLGIKLWQKAGYKFGILTARNSHIVKVRSTELGIDLIRQGFEKKLPVIKEIIESHQLTAKNVCYIGDDLTDLATIKHVGLGVAVGDAVEEVRKAADHSTKAIGGHGAVRELIETILKSKRRWDDLIQRYQ